DCENPAPLTGSKSVRAHSDNLHIWEGAPVYTNFLRGRSMCRRQTVTRIKPMTCVSEHLVLAIEDTAFSLCGLLTALTEHKWSTRAGRLLSTQAARFQKKQNARHMGGRCQYLTASLCP